MSGSYGVTFADDDALPEGLDFALVIMTDGVHAFYRESAISPELLEDSWAAVRELCAVHYPAVASARLDDSYLRAVV